MFDIQTNFCNFAAFLEKGCQTTSKLDTMDILRIKKGFDATLDVTENMLPTLASGAHYVAAIYSRTLDKRYVANGPTTPATGVLRFTWPHGTKTDNDKTVPDPSVKNGTANMEVGKYYLELFASDKTFIADNPNPLVEVEETNMLAINSEPAAEEPEVVS